MLLHINQEPISSRFYKPFHQVYSLDFTVADTFLLPNPGPTNNSKSNYSTYDGCQVNLIVLFVCVFTLQRECVWEFLEDHWLLGYKYVYNSNYFTITKMHTWPLRTDTAYIPNWYAWTNIYFINPSHLELSNLHFPKLIGMGSTYCVFIFLIVSEAEHCLILPSHFDFLFLL